MAPRDLRYSQPAKEGAIPPFGLPPFLFPLKLELGVGV
jgi:hypothetical protein